MTMIPIVIGALGTVHKDFKMGGWKNRKSEDESRRSRLQHHLDLPES